MIPEDVMRSLVIPTDSKIVLLVVDGLGGAPVQGRTELQAADKPYLDQVATESVCGLTHPISMGITPGSGPAHLALFGYDPLKYKIGRGVLEALGVGLEMTDRDVAARCNFATLDKKGTITDRRAGRISTDRNRELCDILRKKIRTIDNAEVIIEPGKEHRFTVLLRGDGLDGRIADADPHVDGKQAAPARALAPEAEPTAKMMNEFIRRATEAVADRAPSNTVLMRGFAKYPSIPSMTDLFKLRPAAIANYPMYRGLAKLVGMEVLDVGDTVESEIDVLTAEFRNYNYFFVHIKATDRYGEDGNFDAKVAAIHHADMQIPRILALEPDVIAITADHSTPAVLKRHSWHPNPFALWSRYARVDDVKEYTEKACAGGGLGQFPAVDVMPLLLAHALKLDKYGA